MSNSENKCWRTIEGYSGYYEISNTGLVKSLAKKGKGNSPHDTIMKNFNNGNGYRYVSLVKDKKRKKHYVHRLLAEAFIPNPENKPFVNHIDGVKHNNELSNLEWSTVSENMAHASSHGLLRVGEKSHLSKLTGTQVKEIRRLWSTGIHRDVLKDNYGISYAQIHRIVHKKLWKHI